ncbi:hypothetical protein ACFLYA_01890, partial [Candidatus Dependentiae bacterium]
AEDEILQEGRDDQESKRDEQIDAELAEEKTEDLQENNLHQKSKLDDQIDAELDEEKETDTVDQNGNPVIADA